MVEFGHSKEGSTKSIFNYSVAYDKDNKLPLFYEAYAGSVVDISQLKCMVDKSKSYGYQRVGFILDRGYFSQSNLNYLDENKYDFCIMMKGKKNLFTGLSSRLRAHSRKTGTAGSMTLESAEQQSLTNCSQAIQKSGISTFTMMSISAPTNAKSWRPNSGR